MRMLAIAATGVRRMFRDRSNYFFVFVLPLGIIIIIGTLFGSGFRPTLGVVGPSEGVGASLVSDIAGIPDVDVIAFDDAESMSTAVERSSIQAGVVVPDDLEARLTDGMTVDIGFVARPDSVGPQLRAIVAAEVDDFSARVLAARSVDAPLGEALGRVDSIEAGLSTTEVSVSVVGEALFESDLGQFDLGASSQLILFMFLTGLTGSAALIQSRQLGVSRRMLSTPTSTRSIVAGEALGRFGVVLVQGLYIVAVTLVVFGVDWGDPLAAAAIILVFGLGAAGAAMLMGALFSNDQQAGGVGVMLGLGLAALGGAMVPIEVMPATMQRVAMFTPHAWAIDAFAELVRRDGGMGDILPQLGVLTAFAAGFLLLAAWRFRVVVTR